MSDNPTDPDIERDLDSWAAASRSGAGFSSDLHRRIRDRLTTDLTPVKPIAKQSTLVLRFLFVFLVYAIGLIAIMDKTGLHLMTAAQIAWTVVLLGGGAILFSIVLGWQMAPGSRHAAPFPVVSGLLGLSVICGTALIFPWRIPGASVVEGWPCAVMETTMALPAAGAFWLLARRGSLFPSAELGAALAGAAVCLALIPLQFQCMFQHAPHLLIWHVGTGVLLIAIGALIGRGHMTGPSGPNADR